MLKDVRVHVAYEGHRDAQAIFIAGTTYDGKRVAISTNDGEIVSTVVDFDVSRTEFAPFLRADRGISDQLFSALAKALIDSGHAPKPVAEDTLALKAHIVSLENEVQRLHTIVTRALISGDTLLTTMKGAAAR